MARKRESTESVDESPEKGAERDHFLGSSDDQRRDEVLKRLLNTPPKPRIAQKGAKGVSESALPAKKKAAKPPSR